MNFSWDLSNHVRWETFLHTLLPKIQFQLCLIVELKSLVQHNISSVQDHIENQSKLIHYNDPDNNCFQAKSYYNTPLNIIISKDLTTSLTTEISIIEPPTPDSNTKTSDIDCNRCENPFVVNKDIVLRVRQGTFTSENDFQNGEIEGDYHEHCLNVS